MSRPSAHLTLLLVPVILASGVLAASSGEQRHRRATDSVFRSGIELIQMSATVVDEEGRLVGDLRREDFEVFEDGERQTVTHFTRARVPLSVGVVLDISQSMYGQRIDDARLALDRFLADLLDPEDEVFVIVFNTRLGWRCPGPWGPGSCVTGWTTSGRMAAPVSTTR